MRHILILTILLITGALLFAQNQSNDIIRPDAVISNYMTAADANVTLYTGKKETPYEVQFTNHPYFETPAYISGTLYYNHVLYNDVLMRLDLYRDEITVRHPGMLNSIVLNSEKFDYAVLNGSVIVKSDADRKTKSKYVVLLHNGTYPVVKTHNINIVEEQSGRFMKRTFMIQQQNAIYSDGMLYPVKNKKSVLKLFPDKKKELNEIAKRNKLDFSRQTTQSIVFLVNHYENITNTEKAGKPAQQ